MSQNNNDKKIEQPTVPTPNPNVDRPKVDKQSLQDNLKEKQRIVRNNETVKK